MSKEDEIKKLRGLVTPALSFMLTCGCGTTATEVSFSATLAAATFHNKGWTGANDEANCPKCAVYTKEKTR